MTLLFHFWEKNPENIIPYHREFCTLMFIDASFTVAIYWNHSSFLSADEWIMKVGTCTHINNFHLQRKMLSQNL